MAIHQSHLKKKDSKPWLLVNSIWMRITDI